MKVLPGGLNHLQSSQSEEDCSSWLILVPAYAIMAQVTPSIPDRHVSEVLIENLDLAHKRKHTQVCRAHALSD